MRIFLLRPLFTLLLAIMGICFCSRNLTLVNNGPGGTDIVGKVLTGEKAESGVIVQFQQTDIPSVPQTTQTDDSGFYQFTIDGSHSYLISYEKEYYKPYTIRFKSDTFENIDTFHAEIVKLEKIPVPVIHVPPAYDSIQGIVTLKWDPVTSGDQYYEINIFNSPNDTNKWSGQYLTASFFADTLFRDRLDTNNEITKRYRVKVTLPDGSSGGWSEPCPVTVKRPKVPPRPTIDTLINTYGTREVTVTYSFPQLWWIDSLFIYRSIKDFDSSVRVASLPIKSDRPMLGTTWTDIIRDFPLSIIDSFLQVTYSLQTKSIDSKKSEFSPAETITVIQYSIPQPAPPRYNTSDTGLITLNDSLVAFLIDPMPSPVSQDTLEYRLVSISSSRDSTGWFLNPRVIVAKFNESGTYHVSCQARSRCFPTLLSKISGSYSLSIDVAK